MVKKITLLMLICSVTFVSSCSPYYCNYAHRDRNYNNDLAFCKQVALGKNPHEIPPPIIYPVNNSGIVTAVDQKGNIYHGTYQSYNSFNDTMNTVNSGLFALNALATPLAEAARTDMCMSKLGWVGVNKEDYEVFLAATAIKPTSNEERQNYLFIIEQRIPKYAIKNNNGDYVDVNKKIFEWIKTKPENERRQLKINFLQAYDGNKFCDVVEQYKNETNDTTI